MRTPVGEVGPVFNVVFISEAVQEWNEEVLETIRLSLRVKLEARQEASRLGECLSRVRFAHYHLYVEAVMSATMVLDTFPYGGCLTTHDALSNGVPMVTLPLEHVRGRYSYGMYSQMGHDGLVASSTEEYVTLALRLFHDVAFRDAHAAAIRRKFGEDIHKNHLVAQEWLTFIFKSWTSLHGV